MRPFRPDRDPSWLDGQTIEHVLNASEMLGMALDHGQDVRPARLTRLERCDALETGFRIYEQGSEAVYAALGHIRHKASAAAVQAGPLAMYGVLYDWLDRRSQLIDPGPIRHILREHILDHDAYMRGDRLLGEVMTGSVPCHLLIPIEARRRYRWGRRASAMAGQPTC